MDEIDSSSRSSDEDLSRAPPRRRRRAALQMVVLASLAKHPLESRRGPNGSASTARKRVGGGAVSPAPGELRLCNAVSCHMWMLIVELPLRPNVSFLMPLSLHAVAKSDTV